MPPPALELDVCRKCPPPPLQFATDTTKCENNT